MPGQPFDVWKQEALPPGSGRYYAWLHNEKSELTAAVLTLISVWSKLCFSNREIDAARKQIEWWRLELQRDIPLHPVTNALQSTAPHQYDQTIEQLTPVLTGYSSLLTEGSPSRATDRFHQQTGALAALAIAGPEQNDNDSDALQRIGVELSRFRCVRYAHKHAANGLLCLPFDEMSEAGVSPSALIPGQYSPELKVFLQQHLTSINEGMERFFAEANSSTRFRFLFVYAKLQQLLLNRYQKDLTLLDNAEFRVTPIRNFWHGWRAHRQFLVQPVNKS